jgi:hypothetical protein
VRQPQLRNARCAACTALSTSCAVLFAISAVTSSVSGLINEKYSPDTLGMKRPAINCSHRCKALMRIDHVDLLRTQIGHQDIEDSVERSPATII